MKSQTVYDIAVIGGGIAGIATAMRLQAKGLRTIIFEAHGQPGGCAGYYKKKVSPLMLGLPLWLILMKMV